MKNSLKKLFLVTLLISGFVVIQAWAVDDNPAEKRMEKMTEKLNLTKEQQAKIEKIFKEVKELIKPLMDQIRAIRENTNSKIELVLNDEQLKKWKELKEKKKERGKNWKKEKIKE